MATPGEGTEVPGAHYQQTMQMVADVEVGGGLWESVAGQGYRAGNPRGNWREQESWGRTGWETFSHDLSHDLPLI